MMVWKRWTPFEYGHFLVSMYIHVKFMGGMLNLIAPLKLWLTSKKAILTETLPRCAMSEFRSVDGHQP